MDGQVARQNLTPNEFGKELDSLVDAVSFGIAPAILGYIFIYRTFHLLSTLALLLYLFCSVWRLAKYNITPKEEMKNYFYGLPTTASGGMLASFILIFRKKHFVPLPEFVPTVFLFLVLILAFLMISQARYLNLDGLKQLCGKRRTVIIVLALAVLLVIEAFLRKSGITAFTLFLIYLIFSPFVVKRLDRSL
uniref:CDP-diacylglycerol--serine O-phosphatidyltransferase n=1 Tax=uncultured microorganism TaxID=358574 RepID=F8UHL9_9ZZZZ|nr:CDP-diacylglycerol--serine O-phosphatidyltransferase [uncultured microorganism]